MAETRVRELRIFTPDGQTKTIRLEGARFSLGRSSANNEQYFPEDAGLSRQHLALEREGDEWNIQDLNSKNGTLLNSVKLTTPTRLRPGDRISAGHLVIVYDDASATGQDSGVEFFEGKEEENSTSSTVVTNLAGLLAATSAGKAEESSGSLHVAALIKAGNELALERPLPELFRIILDLSIEAVSAERGLLMTLEGDGQLIVRAAKGDAFRISTTVRDRVLNTKVSVLVRDAQLDAAFNTNSIVGQRIRTLIAVPLQTKEQVLGLIYVDSPSLTRVFTKEDLNLLTVMANTAAIRIENARLAEEDRLAEVLRRELRQAADIQRGFLPSEAPILPGLDLAGHNAPCRTVGGDYYDFFPYATGRVAMVLGDVSGKGMPASLLMMSLHSRVQDLIDEPANLGEFMTRLNRLTCAKCPSNRFITFFVCMLDSKTGELSYCNAGHNPPLVIRRDGSVERLEASGVVLGIVPQAIFEESRTRLELGDLLVIYSDGVTEATNPVNDEFEEDRLIAAASARLTGSSAAVLESVNGAITEWSAGSPPADDLTLIVARRVG